MNKFFFQRSLISASVFVLEDGLQNSLLDISIFDADFRGPRLTRSLIGFLEDFPDGLLTRHWDQDVGLAVPKFASASVVSEQALAAADLTDAVAGAPLWTPKGRR